MVVWWCWNSRGDWRFDGSCIGRWCKVISSHTVLATVWALIRYRPRLQHDVKTLLLLNSVWQLCREQVILYSYMLWLVRWNVCAYTRELTQGSELHPSSSLFKENPTISSQGGLGTADAWTRETEADNWSQKVLFHYICFLYMFGIVHTKLFLDYLSSWFLSKTIYAYSTNHSLPQEHRDHKQESCSGY